MRNFLALPVINSVAFLLRLVFSLLHRNLLTHFLSFVLGHLFVVSVALLLILSAALLPGHIGAHLLSNLTAHLSGLVVAVCGGQSRCDRLLQILTLLHRNQSAQLRGNRLANLLIHQLSVGGSLGVALSTGHLFALLLGLLLAHLL